VVSQLRRGTRGSSRLGCLFSILLVTTIVYYGVDVGRIFWEYYRLSDEMEVSARFAQGVEDQQILLHLRSVADELGLPPEAKKFRIRRVGHPPTIIITTSYQVTIELPFKNKVIRFHPSAQVQRFQ
jgi:hypothetical protein